MELDRDFEEPQIRHYTTGVRLAEELDSSDPTTHADLTKYVEMMMRTVLRERMQGDRVAFRINVTCSNPEHDHSRWSPK